MRYRFAGFEFDAASGRLYRSGKSISMPAKALLLLRCLLDRAGSCVSTADCLDALRPRIDIGEENVTQYVALLRSAFGDSSRDPQFIQTEYGRGYRFIAPVSRTGENIDFAIAGELLEAKYNLDRRRPQTLRAALAQFSEIVRRYPENAEAHLGTAETCATLGSHLFDAPGSVFPRAQRHSALARTLGGESARAESVSALTALFWNHDVDGAQEHCMRALRLDGSDVLAFRVMSRICMIRKQFGQAQYYLHEELRVRPDSMDALVMLAVLEQYQHRPEKAAALLQKTCRLDDTYRQARYYLGTALTEAGNPDDAIDALRLIPQNERGSAVLAALGRAYAVARKPRRARSMLAALLERKNREYVSPYLLASLHIALAERENAKDCMQQAAREHDPWAVFFSVEPRFEAVRL